MSRTTVTHRSVENQSFIDVKRIFILLLSLLETKIKRKELRQPIFESVLSSNCSFPKESYLFKVFLDQLRYTEKN